MGVPVVGARAARKLRQSPYVDDAGEVAKLRRLDLGTGTDIAVATGVEPDAVAPALDVARDGSVAMFARVDEVSIDVMLAPRAFEAARQ